MLIFICMSFIKNVGIIGIRDNRKLCVCFGIKNCCGNCSNDANTETEILIFASYAMLIIVNCQWCYVVCSVPFPVTEVRKYVFDVGNERANNGFKISIMSITCTSY